MCASTLIISKKTVSCVTSATNSVAVHSTEITLPKRTISGKRAGSKATTLTYRSYLPVRISSISSIRDRIMRLTEQDHTNSTKPLVNHVPNAREVHCDVKAEEMQKTRCPRHGSEGRRSVKKNEWT